ncbi:MAG: Proposed peptidoglycan lipid II flippase MurJ, partial [uncultured Sphingomonas sp.]
ADHAPGLRARRVRRRVDPADRRGALLVLVLPAVQRHQPAADPLLLLPPAPVAADGARGRLARGQPRGGPGALPPARDRRHRHRHGGLDRRDGDRAGGLPPSRARGPRRRPHPLHARPGAARVGGLRARRLRHLVRPRRGRRALPPRPADLGRRGPRGGGLPLHRNRPHDADRGGRPDPRPVRPQAPSPRLV